MDARPENPFSAAPSAIGYLFQCRYALLESLRRLRNGETFTVSIETLDDVVFEPTGSAPDLLQFKHHTQRAADLTDASVDLWKTVRIWSEGKSSGTIPPGSRLFLVTTSQCGSGSAAGYLRLSSDRSPEKAVERLNATAISSTNKANLEAYQAFKSLTQTERLELAEAITVLDAAPVITDLDTALRKEVYFAAPQQHLTPFLERLEGWWLRRAIKHLTERSAAAILSEELEDEAALLREQFKQDNLPIDDEVMDAAIDASGYQDRTFVQQLRLVEIGNPRVFHAIRNYFRAFEQRSRWIRDDLLLVGELDRYEDRLVEEWDLLFQQMHEALGEAATEAAMKEAAQKLYKWVEAGTHRPIRPGVSEPAIARGSYQILADRRPPRVGWHPFFRDRLARVLHERGGK